MSKRQGNWKKEGGQRKRRRKKKIGDSFVMGDMGMTEKEGTIVGGQNGVRASW